ncbi:hypothetical protein Ddye_023594 [Dipteronia dyeriana]|uniref:Cytochrome P450 n=1 Tax=Dipteronia dyeriana TaxID=168575 RepID=A0AAD9TTC4_9ROSI|nr:hypothetical protein Ddye_023594 [Dipteronia dyeriana]
MEFFFVCGMFLFTLFVSVSLAYIFFNKPKNLPPGKMGLPYIGESLEFLSTAKNGHPDKFIFDRLAKYSSKVFKTSILTKPTAVFCGPAANKFLFSNENKIVNVWFPESVTKIFPSTASVKEESLKMRKMLPSFLKPEALMKYIGVMDQIAKKHFESDWEGKQQVKVFPLAKRYTFWVACKLFLSIEDPKHIAKFADPFKNLIAGIYTIPLNFPGTPYYRSIQAAKDIRKELMDIITQRKIDLQENRASPTQDLLSYVLQETDDNGQPMSDLFIADKIIGLLIGGHDTASSTISFIVKYLAELPHVYNEVFKEQMEIAKSKKPGEFLNWDDLQKMKYSWNVACEVLRITPPLQGAFREAINDFIFNGFSIPKGWKIYWSTYSTHKDSEYFPEPEKFDPTRFEGKGPAPYTYVPFGGGPRMCPGKEYARLEILVFMHNLIKRFNWEQLLRDEKTVAEPIPTPANGLPVRLIPHKA